MLRRQSGCGLARRQKVDEVRLRQNRRCRRDERLRQMDQRADRAMIPVGRVGDAGRIVLVFGGRDRLTIAVRVRMGIDMCDVRMIVIGGVDMDVSRRDDELDQQRGERETRSPFLTQPEPAHRRVPRQTLPAARRDS